MGCPVDRWGAVPLLGEAPAPTFPTYLTDSNVEANFVKSKTPAVPLIGGAAVPLFGGAPAPPIPPVPPWRRLS